jgi:NAD(P)-dependent dehydrogenase (short-subunit alcohol dehydrogenase family)
MGPSAAQSYHLPSNAVWFSKFYSPPLSVQFSCFLTGKPTKVTPVTGCSSGIGKALSQLVASKPGQRLVCTARDVSALSYLPDSTQNILKLSLDVTSQPSVDAAVAAALSRFGRVDVFVNNAGYTLSGDTENADDEEARRCVETDFWGMVRLTKHALRVLREENAKGNDGQRGGVVMNVSSMGGRMAYAGNAFYHASKFAMEGFTEAVSKEVRPEWNSEFLNPPTHHHLFSPSLRGRTFRHI